MPTVITANHIINYDLNPHEKYYRDLPVSEDLILTREYFFENLAKNFIEDFKINNYIQINDTCAIPYGNNWLDFDEVERRAFEIAVNKINIERHKATQNEKDELEKKLESFIPHKSGFSDIPMPSIRMS
jgi:hypothetical protein